jgi:hypothetical protein
MSRPVSCLLLALLGSCAPTSSFERTRTPVSVVVVGDLDGDGWKDLAVVDGAGGIRSRVTFVSARSGDELWSRGGIDDVLGDAGDLDGDGRDDVALSKVRFGILGFSIETRVRSGATGATVLVVTESEPGVMPGSSVLSLPDVDGDGTPDLLLGVGCYDRPDLVRAISGATGETLYEIEGRDGMDDFGGWTRSVTTDRGPAFWVGTDGHRGTYCHLVLARTGEVLARFTPYTPPKFHTTRFELVPTPGAPTPCLVAQVRARDPGLGRSVVRDQWFGEGDCFEAADLPAERDCFFTRCGDLDGDGAADWISEPWKSVRVLLSSGGERVIEPLWSGSARSVDAEHDLDGDGWNETVVVEKARVPHGERLDSGEAAITVLSGAGGDVLIRWRREPGGELVRW